MNSFGGFWCGHKFRIQKKVLGFTIFGIHFPFIHLQRCHPRDWIYITLFPFCPNIWDMLL